MSFYYPCAFHARSFYEQKFVISSSPCIPEYVLPMCDLCQTFDNNSNSCPQYVRLKVEIKNSIKSAFNSMKHMMGEKNSELVQKQNQYNSNEDEHTFKESPLGESCEEVVIEASSPSPNLIHLVSYSSLVLVPARFSCSTPSHSLEFSLVKPVEEYVITDLNDDIGLVDIENNRLDERVNEFHRSLGNYKQFNSLTNSYWLCLEDMPKKVI